MKYIKDFDSEICEYLLENDRYKIFFISISLGKQNGINDFIDFLKRVPDLSDIEFEQVGVRCMMDSD